MLLSASRLKVKTQIARNIWRLFIICVLLKTSIGNAPISKNEMEALITNHVKEYVLTNT